MHSLTRSALIFLCVSCIQACGGSSTGSSTTVSDKSTITAYWLATTRNIDNSCANISSYKISYGLTTSQYTNSTTVSLNSAAINCSQTDFDTTCNTPILTCGYTADNLTSGRWYFSVQAIDDSSNESVYSNEMSMDI